MNTEETVQIKHLSTAQLRGSRKQNTVFIVTVLVSLLIHGTAVAGLAIWKGRTPARVDLKTSIPVQLVRLGKKRDPKLLPRKVAPPPPPASDGIALDTGKKKDRKKTKDKNKTKEQAKMSDAARRLLAGRSLDEAMAKFESEVEGDPNGDPFGTTTDATNAATGYHAEIVRALKANYRIPTVIPPSQRRFLKAKVVLWIERNGRISKHEFVERHSNRVFMGALETMLKSVKLPPPPAALTKSLSRDGVAVVFRP